MRLLAWLVSKWYGRRIGEIRYTQALPFVVGSFVHFLPFGCQGERERSALRYCYNQERWNGFAWEHVERLELTRDQWRDRLESEGP